MPILEVLISQVEPEETRQSKATSMTHEARPRARQHVCCVGASASRHKSLPGIIRTVKANLYLHLKSVAPTYLKL